MQSRFGMPHSFERNPWVAFEGLTGKGQSWNEHVIPDWSKPAQCVVECLSAAIILVLGSQQVTNDAPEMIESLKLLACPDDAELVWRQEVEAEKGKESYGHVLLRNDTLAGLRWATIHHYMHFADSFQRFPCSKRIKLEIYSVHDKSRCAHFVPGLIGCMYQAFAWSAFALYLRYASAGVDDCLVNIKMLSRVGLAATANSPTYKVRTIALMFSRKNFCALERFESEKSFKLIPAADSVTPIR